jgi:chromosome segregation ATPase
MQGTRKFDDFELFDDASEIDSKNEITELGEANRQLRSDLEQTKAQYDSVLKSVSDAQRIHQENALLRQQLIESKTELDDIRQRLAICAQANSELSERLQRSQVSMERTHQGELAELQSQIASMQQRGVVEVDQLKQKLQQTNEQSFKLQTDNASLRSQLSKLLSAAQTYFQNEFTSASGLLEFLLHPRPAVPRVSAGNNSDLEEQLKKTRRRLEKEVARRKRAELEVLRLERTAESDAVGYTAALNECQEQLRNRGNELKRMKEEHTQEILALQNQFPEARRSRSVSTQTLAVHPGPTEKQCLKAQVKDDRDVIAALEQKLKELTAAASGNAGVIDSLRRKAKQDQTTIAELTSELKTTRKTITKLQGAVENGKTDCAMLREARELGNKQLFECQANAAAELKRANQALSSVEAKLAEQSEELAKITSDRDRLVSVVDHQSGLLTTAEKAIIALESKRLQAPAVVTMNQERVAWDFGTLPDGLTDILRGIADNDGFALEIRIKQAFALVSKWIQKLEDSHAHAIQAANEETRDATRTLTAFAGTIANVVEADPRDLRQIHSKVNELHKQYMKLQQQCCICEGKDLVAFNEETYRNLQNTIATLEETTQRLKAKASRRKRELRECKAAFLTCRDHADTDIETLRAESERAESHIAALQAEIDALQEKNAVARSEVARCKQEQIDESSRCRAEFDAMLAEQSSRYEELQTTLTETRKEQKEIIGRLQAKNSELIENNVRQEASLKHALEELEDQREELAALRARKNEMEESEVQVSHDVERIVQERQKNSRRDYNEALSKLAALQAALESKEETIRQLTAQVDELHAKLKKAHKKVQVHTEQVERQKKLLEVQTKAKLMAAEAEFNVRTEELRHECGTELHRLYAYMAEQFQIYFDASVPINESSFRQIVSRVKSEFDRHKRQETAIRKLVKAKESQTTAEALMELMVLQKSVTKPAF